MKDLIVLRGGGDLATGIAQKLFALEENLLILEIPYPTVIRRTVALSNAMWEGEMRVENLVAVKVDDWETAQKVMAQGKIPVLEDPEGKMISRLSPGCVVDGIMAKKNYGTYRSMAPITIGVGPGFTAGEDVDAVVETKRGHHLGKVIYRGAAEKNTGIPGIIGGYGKERVIHAPASGKVRVVRDIGSVVKQGEPIAYIDRVPVPASISGVLRGMIHPGAMVPQGMKIADIDGRDVVDHCYSISDKARAVGGGVLEAYLTLKKIRKSKT